MKTRDFYFDLPPELIAQNPPEQRGQSRLLVYDRSTGTIVHSHVTKLAEFIAPATLMVFNDTKVRKARLFAQSSTGGKIETLLLEQDDDDPKIWLCMVRKAGRLRPGSQLVYPEGLVAEVIDGEAEFRRLRFRAIVDDAWLDRVGHIPLPPYIKRPDSVDDMDRYQTIYAAPNGSVAAPTAGLHFTPEIMAALDGQGIRRQTLTLHVGLGTFLPIRSENIQDHHMHRERFWVSETLSAALAETRLNQQKVLAVGTTSLRALESAAFGSETSPATPQEPVHQGSSLGWRIQAGAGSTDIFIRPGYRFRCVDQLFTNFHTPESTLLILVSAFVGVAEIRRIYAEAIKERYRFFSYGDAMLIL